MPSVLDRLRDILSRELATGAIPEEDLEMIAASSRGDLRKAVMLLELAVRSENGRSHDALEPTGTERAALGIIHALRRGEQSEARRLAESLMIDGGLSGRELLMELRKAARRDYNEPALAIAIAETDVMLGEGGGEFVQIGALLARAGAICR
jgi:replication factor C small subunit